MTNVIEKLGSYQIMTNLLPGAFFCMALKIFFGLSLPIDNIAEEILAYYFMGFVINRIGSLVVKPILLKLKFISEAPYAEYLRAVKVDAKQDILSETNNFFRSVLTSFLLLPIVGLVNKLARNVGWIEKNWKVCIMLLLIVLFLFAYQKQTDIVQKRTKIINEQHKECSVEKN